MSPGSPWERTVAASKAYASQLDAMPAMTPTSRLSPTSRSSASPASPAARFWDEGRPSPRRDLKFRCLRKRGGPDPAFGAGGLKASASCGSLLTERSAYAADEAASLLGRTLVVSEVVRAGTRSPPPPSTLRRVPFARRPQTAPLPHLMPLGAGGASVRSYGDGSQTWDAKRAAIDGRRKLMQDALLAKQQQADAKEAGREARLAMKSGPDAERTAQGWLEVVALVARTAAMGPRAEAKIALRRHERAEYMAALALQRFMAARFWKALHLKMRKARRAMKRVKWRLCLAARCFRRRHATLVLRTFYREHGGSPFEFMMRRYKMRVVSLQRKIADFLRITYCRMYVLKLRWNRLESAARAEIEADRTHQQRNKPVFARPPRLAPMRVHDAKYPNYCAKVNRASNEGGKLMDTTYVACCCATLPVVVTSPAAALTPRTSPTRPLLRRCLRLPVVVARTLPRRGPPLRLRHCAAHASPLVLLPQVPAGREAQLHAERCRHPLPGQRPPRAGRAAVAPAGRRAQHPHPRAPLPAPPGPHRRGGAGAAVAAGPRQAAAQVRVQLRLRQRLREPVRRGGRELVGPRVARGPRRAGDGQHRR